MTAREACAANGLDWDSLSLKDKRSIYNFLYSRTVPTKPAVKKFIEQKKAEEVVRIGVTVVGKIELPDRDKYNTKGKCYYCERPYAGKRIKTKEHIIPRSKGGDNAKSNIVYACNLCNNWRDNKSYAMWVREILDLLQERRTKPPFKTSELLTIIKNVKSMHTNTPPTSPQQGRRSRGRSGS